MSYALHSNSFLVGVKATLVSGKHWAWCFGLSIGGVLHSVTWLSNGIMASGSIKNSFRVDIGERCDQDTMFSSVEI